jgi:hypothetical protein
VRVIKGIANLRKIPKRRYNVLQIIKTFSLKERPNFGFAGGKYLIEYLCVSACQSIEGTQWLSAQKIWFGL